MARNKPFKKYWREIKMPYTKRSAHYGSPKQLIEYILDEKNIGEKVAVASSLNCNVDTALYEMLDVQKKYEMQGNRVAYHIIQSFALTDKITPEQANEIARKLCKELYPDFQCVIATHCDRGHLHNHICLNAINMNGKKLEDRLANYKEGLYGLSEISDKISSEYGCYIMPKRIFSKVKDKNYYYQYKKQTYKEKIKSTINDLLPKCNTLDELLDELSILGYEVKRGKHIAVKITGMERFMRIDTISNEFSTDNLYNYFKNINNLKILGLKTTENEFNSKIYYKALESKEAIEKSQLSTENKIYTEYQKTKYQEVKRYYQLKQQLEYLDKYNIRSFNDVDCEIQSMRNQIKSRNIALKKFKTSVQKIIENTEKAHDFINLYELYENAMYFKEQDFDYILPKEVEIFLNIKKELGFNSVDDAKLYIKKTCDERIKLNQLKKEILDMQRELNHLDTIKEEKLSNSNLFIHNIKFGSNRIEYSLSDDDNFCINLPYTKEKIHIPKKYVAYNEKNKFYTLYLVDDKEYELFNEKNEKMKNIKGIELEKYVLEKKKEIDSLYASINIA